MTRPLLVFVHGWGFDRTIWQPLGEALCDFDQIALDFGYFDAERLIEPVAKARKIIAIGHSFGVLWLLHQQPFSWDGLVSINGFSRFAAGEDFPAGIAPRILRRMSIEFDQQPEKVLAQFRERCGAADMPKVTMEVSRLRADLAALADWDARGSLNADPRSLRVLASSDDPIVPASLTEQSFAAQTEIRWNAGSNHLLPVTYAQWCAAEIRDFAKRLGFTS